MTIIHVMITVLNLVIRCGAISFSNIQLNETDLALYNLDVHDKVMLTMRLWTNANYDSNATITVLVDGDIVAHYRRSTKDCVVDGWLGYPVGGTQKQTCFMDLKEIVNHTRDAINVKIGIYFDGEARLIHFLVSANPKYIYLLFRNAKIYISHQCQLVI